MRHPARRKKLNRSGFTLPELLVTVAILAITASLAIPALASSWRDLRITELDETARELFLCAQNELVGMKASGQLQAMGGTLGTPTAETLGAQTVNALSSKQAEAALDRTAALLTTTGGSYVLYFSPATGDATDVYYARGPLSAETAAALRAELGGRDDQARRAEEGIGYYGGLSVSSAALEEIDTSQHVEKKLEIVNQEDLYLRLTYPKLRGAVLHPELLEAAVTVTDEDGHTQTLTADGDGASGDTAAAWVRAGTVTNGDYTLCLLLDSLAEGCGFADICPDLTPGSDLTVSVSLTYNGAAAGQIASLERFNSLYARKYAADAADASGAARRAGDLEFRYVRQLSNLRYVNKQNTTAVQTADIDFTRETRQAAMMPGNEGGAPETFAPISLTAQGCAGLTVDGGDRRLLKNFQIEGQAATGLFGEITRAVTLQNLLLTDPAVRGTKEVGALAGRLKGAVTVTGCGVYLSAAGKGAVRADAGGDSPVGGLVGTVETGSAGETVRMTGCFAALPVTGSEIAGGLIGKWNGGSLTDCYASGTVTAARTAGGLIGRVDGSGTLLRCLSVSDVYGDGAGSIAGGIQAGAALSVGQTLCCGLCTDGGKQTYGPLLGGTAAGSTVSFAETRYLSQSGSETAADFYAERKTTLPGGVTACEYDALSAGVANDAARCHPYLPALAGKPFPFPMVTEEYYGDWPQRIEPVGLKLTEDAYLVYYEVYGDGGYGYYLVDPAGETQSTLDNDRTIRSWGYGVLKTNSGYELKNEWGSRIQTQGGPVSVGAHKLETLKTPSNFDPASIAASVTVRLGETRYRVNGYYAAAILRAADGELGTQAHPYLLRTADQLANFAEPNSYGGRYFRQDRDIAADDSTGGLTNRTHTYDGGGYALADLTQPLFLRNDGTLQRIRLEGVNISQTGNAAALALTSSGTVTDCAVASGTVHSTSGAAAGLLYSVTGGTVTDCAVASGTVRSTSGAAAGLLYSVTGGTVTDCTVGGEGETPAVTVSANDSFSGEGAAGLIGSLGSADSWYNPAVSGCTVTNTAVVSYSGRAAGAISFLYGTAKNCAVLESDVTGAYHAAGFCVDNYGTVTRCFVRGGSVESTGTVFPYASGFAYSNRGWGYTSEVTQCCVTGVSVTATGAACGFLFQNEAEITECYAADNTVRATDATGSEASAFVLKNEGWFSEISDCFALGSARGTWAAGALTISNSGTITRCYAAADLSQASGRVYGLCPDDGTVEDCYWSALSELSTASGGTKVPLEELTATAMEEAFASAAEYGYDEDRNWVSRPYWTTDSAGHTFTADGAPSQEAYPYPRLAALDFYGTWPTPGG